jgi:hypothetical protein
MLNSVSMLHTCESKEKKYEEKNLMPKTRDNEKHDDKLILKIYGINHTKTSSRSSPPPNKKKFDSL